jgi:hypothetical protein
MLLATAFILTGCGRSSPIQPAYPRHLVEERLEWRWVDGKPIATDRLLGNEWTPSRTGPGFDIYSIEHERAIHLGWHIDRLDAGFLVLTWHEIATWDGREWDAHLMTPLLDGRGTIRVTLPAKPVQP